LPSELPDLGLRSSKSVATGSFADLLHGLSAIDLRKKGAQRVFSADAVAVVLEELEPVSVMDLLAASHLLVEQLDRDIEEPLALEPTVDVVDRELNGPAKGALKLLQETAFALRLIVDAIGEKTEALGLLGLCLDPTG